MKFGNSFLINVLLILLLLVSVPQINLEGYPQSTITSKFIVFAYFCVGLPTLFILGVFKLKTINLSFSRIDISLAVLFVFIVINRYFFQTDYGFSIRFMELFVYP